ncbi:MAG: PKD domain-containing protein [bacterium]|nr:PKD domain-containing protein [bacterium]
MKQVKHLLVILGLVVSLPMFVGGNILAQSIPDANPDDEGIGMEGRIQQAPPSQAPTISLPSNGASFDSIPVTVTGLCQDTLLVRVFRNNVFSGAAICDGGSYEMQIDLFPGVNELIARQYDDLDQASPDSNRRTVRFNIDTPAVPTGPNQVAQRITLTTNFARRGADPGKNLVWPITLSGGRGPYAISIDWGDGKTDLLTRNAAGTFDINHIYERPGIYRVLVKGTDADGESAFLQLVGVGNGSINTALEDLNDQPTVIKTRVLWQPALLLFPLLLTSFWLGKRYQLKKVRYRIKNKIMPIDR